MENINEVSETKKIEREIEILRWQNDRLLKYLRANKIFYKNRLDNLINSNMYLKKEIEDQRAQIITLQKEARENEPKSN